MILLLAFIAGFVFGWRRAARRNGSRADRVQYGLAHGLAFLVGAAMLALIAALAGYSPL
jgi:hypothetical protein